ncbi:hypothetical protein GCM10022254_43270 [Actinomadura meridiana]|uniref:Uncharacterized protein n=2 Tax=Actinomadura meridiana TaxID=559626 RepID=A0ABP8C973_9ACTN
MGVLSKIWMRWQLEALRIRFPEWDIVRTGRDVWHIKKPPVNRVIIGRLETVHGEIEWFEKLLGNGVVPVGRLRSSGGRDAGAECDSTNIADD